VPARAGKAKRIATWRPTLTAPGDYRIALRIPSRDATTRKAVYRIKTVDGWVKHRLDQSIAQGKWVDVGTFRLTTTPAVKLTDRTGERASLGRRVGFDAIRFVPVAQPRVSSDPASPADETSAGAPAPAGPEAPTAQPAADPTPEPTKEPAADPKPEPTPEAPTAQPAADPTPDRTKDPTPDPTPEQTPEPTKEPTPERTKEPGPTPEPTPERTPDPTPEPTPLPSPEPIAQPAAESSAEPDPSPATG
jgi:outer membrane biosynthesis protein TonB